MREITQMSLLCGIAVLAAACGGGGGGGGSGVVSSTGETESVATSTMPGSEDSTTEVAQTERYTTLNHGTISWLLNKSTVRLNKNPGASNANQALATLPGDYFNGRNALRAETSKSTPNANLYLNHSQIFGNHEGKAAQNPDDEDNEPGTWILEAGCLSVSKPGSCRISSNYQDSLHVIVTEDGEISPYYAGLYRRSFDGSVEACFGRGANCVSPGNGDNVTLVPTFEADTDYQPIMTVNGVEMVQTRGIRRGARTAAETGALVDPRYDFVGYGAWMDHSGFFAEGYLYDDTGNGRKQEVAAWALGIKATGIPSLPAAGEFLSWRGAMVGMVTDQTPRQLTDPYDSRNFDPVQGDAEIMLNSDGDFRIALTDIFYLTQSGSLPDIVWGWGPETNNGDAFFGENENQILGAANRLRAAFYGPNHEEIAGTFESRVSRNEYLLGAFGTKRTE